ncbi:MAG: hypothetical protein OSB24_08815 [Woeseiaceae bacterium]|nr:hypothetical protein [Woeseiaceae bacterium]
MKYMDYLIFIMGLSAFIYSFFDETSARFLFSAFGFLMMIYSGMNIDERSRSK